VQKDSLNSIQKLKIGTQREDVDTNLFPSRKIKCIAPRHFFPAFRSSGKKFYIRGKIPDRSGIKVKEKEIESSFIDLYADACWDNDGSVT
jgi:hypothetical protein